MTELDFVWLSGLLEGEGSFMCGPPSKPNKPIVAVHMTDQDVVARVAVLFGGLKVQFRKAKNPAHKDTYYVSIRGDGAARLMQKLRPLMSSRRQYQIITALDDWIPSWDISDQEYQELVSRAVTGESMRELAEEYGVSYSYVKKHKYASPDYVASSKT